MSSNFIQISNYLKEAKNILAEINHVSDNDLISKIDNYQKIQPEFNLIFTNAQKLFLQNEDQLTEEELKNIISAIKEINVLLFSNDQKIKKLTKKIKLDTIHQQIDTI